MKFYSIVIKNQRIIHHKCHETWFGAFRTLIDFTNQTFKTDVYDAIFFSNRLKEDNYFTEDINHNNSYTFEILTHSNK